MTTRWDELSWEGFELLSQDLLAPPRNVNREEAWRRHRDRLRRLPDRLRCLETVAHDNGVIVGDRGRRHCDALESWVREVATRRGDLLDRPDAPLLSLMHDVGMMFGDELIARYSTPSWQLKRGSPKNVFYHFTVLMGFSRAASNFDLEMSFSFIEDVKGQFMGDAPRPWFAGLVEFAEKYA